MWTFSKQLSTQQRALGINPEIGYLFMSAIFGHSVKERTHLEAEADHSLPLGCSVLTRCRTQTFASVLTS